jgi:hypothetical protein
MTIRNTVALKKYTDSYIERVANAAITPGHLVQLMSTDKVRAHAAASGNALPKMFAVEDELQGKGIDSAYAQGDPVQIAICQPGDVIYALLYDGEKVDIGDALESQGDGTLRKVVADSTGIYYYNQIVGIAQEALDLTSSSGAEPTMRIPVMIV